MHKVDRYTASVQMLKQALQQLQGAQADVSAGGQAYLSYLINRTQAYIMHLDTLIAWDQAYLDLDRAFRRRDEGGSEEEFVTQLDRVLGEFGQTRQQARAMAEKWSETIDHPSDLGVLYRINLFMVTGTELTFDLMQNVDNFHHGRDYVKPVAFDKIFVSWPVVKPVK